jgi:hypothetical protein
MKETHMSLPELALVAITRAGLGFGVGLLAANRMSREARRAAGIAMIVVGAISTIPLAIEVFAGRQRTIGNARMNGHTSPPRRASAEGLPAD